MSQFRSNRASFSSRQQRMWRRNQNTVAFAPAMSLGPVTHTILVVLMVAVLGLIYLTQVTKTSFYGYELDRRETVLADLRDEQEDLKNENARLQALDRVSKSSVAATLTEPSSVEYAN